MPECPICLESSSRRSRGRCPRCGALVFSYRSGQGKNKKTVWVEEKPSCKELVEYLRSKIAKYRKVDLVDFVFDDYKTQLVSASVLLHKLNGNMALAYLLIDQFFRRPRQPGLARVPQSMRGIIWIREDENASFNLALAYARADLRKQNAENLERVEMF